MDRSRYYLLTLAIGCLVVCIFWVRRREERSTEHPEEDPGGNRAKIRTALTALLRRENDDAFVVFEEKHTQKFVQFAGSAHQALLLDVPAQTLDQAHVQQVESCFRDLGVRAKKCKLYDAPGGKVVGQLRSFQKKFGRDVEAATKVTAQIFERVYQFPADFELVVIEN